MDSNHVDSNHGDGKHLRLTGHVASTTVPSLGKIHHKANVLGQNS